MSASRDQDEGPFGGDPDYEAPERLADTEQQNAIANILHLSKEGRTNTRRLRSPSRAGAGRVNPFVAGNESLESARPEPAAPAPRTNIFSGLRRTGARARSDVEMSIQSAPGNADGGTNGSTDVNEPQPAGSKAGYSALAEFMASDAVFSIFRRFDALTVRSLLHLQDELCELEERLNAADDADLATGGQTEMVSLHSRRHDQNQQRKALLADIQVKLKAYHSAVNTYAAVGALRKPQQLHLSSVRNWLDGKKPTVEVESHFLDYERDLMSMFPGAKRPGSNILEIFIEERFSSWFSTKRHKSRSKDAAVEYYSRSNIRRVVRTILTVLAVFLLLAPVIALYYVQQPWAKLVVIVIFSLCFALALAIWTKSRNHEIFVALATYSAVLVIFISSNYASNFPAHV